MGLKWCHEGEHQVKVAFRPSAGEAWCPQHATTRLQPLPSKPAGLGARPESSAERFAGQRFNDAVKAKRCFYSEQIDGESRRRGHACTYPLDAHHVVEKQWIRREFGDLPEDELIAIVFDPRIGSPLCRGGHENVKRLRIYWHEVTDACKLFCREIDERYGDDHPSMYERLRRECLEPESAIHA
jgi:hypothetical protein